MRAGTRPGRQSGKELNIPEQEQEPHPESSVAGSPGGWRIAAGAVAAVAAIGVIVALVGFAFHAGKYSSPAGTEVASSLGTATVAGKTMPHVALHFDTYPDASGVIGGVPIRPGGNPNWPSYGPTNVFQVPAHALVTVTVRQYDSGGSLNNPWFDAVRGTVGGTARIDGKVVRRINPNNVGHTFTLRGTPGTDPGYLVSVPLPLVGGNNQTDTGAHHTIVFSFVTGPKGLYAWNCEFPCGISVAGFGGPMGTFGYMSGFVHVV